MHDQDLTHELQQQVQAAIAAQQPLRIAGGDSKAFYSRFPNLAQNPIPVGAGLVPAPALQMTAHRGIVGYEPSELVITARTGTPLRELEALLAAHGQMLAFEPPHFADTATVGGMVACGLSGPRRPFAGSVRDFVLGCKMINGYGEVLSFGGQVIKNVAGFDVSRLMAGSMGTLGVLLEVSLRVLPKPDYERSYCYPLTDANQAIVQMNRWMAQPWPLSALAYEGDAIIYRLSGAEAAVKAAAQALGGDALAEGDTFWQDLREQRLAFFQHNKPLWRLSVAPATPVLDLPGESLLDWGGALRWLKTGAAGETIHQTAQAAGGFACCFHGGTENEGLTTNSNIAALNQRVRQAFDPLMLFNRDYPPA